MVEIEVHWGYEREKVSDKGEGERKGKETDGVNELRGWLGKREREGGGKQEGRRAKNEKRQGERRRRRERVNGMNKVGMRKEGRKELSEFVKGRKSETEKASEHSKEIVETNGHLQ